MQPHGILETAVYAQDLDAAERFYADVLGLTVILREAGRHVFFRCGAGVFLVFHPAITVQPLTQPGHIAVPPHGTTGAGHMAFAMRESEIAAWRERLAAHGVAIEQETVWPNGGHSLYFRDPAGNSIELATPRLWGIEDNTIAKE